ncbi:MAG TPA: DUF2079 domain-containing protein [Chloroflexota bacterium]|nr:DUF2079 domain-containing protein [Chloroflexota bacterium]
MSEIASPPDLHAGTLRPTARWRLPRPQLPLALGIVCTAAYAGLFAWLSLSSYWAFEMHALDMGNMGQAAWNTLHGQPFYFTNMRLPYAIEAWGSTTRLSFHVEALFPVISLVYLFYPHPESLLLLQTLAISSGALAVYLLGRDILRSGWLALTFVAAYLLYPAVEGLNLYEFHPVALATPLLLFAFLFLWRRRWLAFVLCCLAAMGTKEEIGLVVSMFGLYAAFFRGRREVGLPLAAAGAAWSLFAVLVIEHHYRVPGSISYAQSRYGYLGHGLQGAVHTIVHNPGVFAQVLFTWPKLGYLVRLLAPLGFLSVLDPPALLLGLPTFGLNLLSQDFHMYSGLGDNSAELLAVVVIASILGARRLIDLLSSLPVFRGPRASVLAGIWVVLLATLNQYQDGFTPLGGSYHVPAVGAHQRIAEQFIAMIPPGVPVSTQDQLDPHLSSRHYLYLFNDTGRVPPLAPADYILLDVSAPTYPLPSWQLHDYATGWIRTAGWGVAAARDGLILIRRGATRRSIPPAFYSYALALGDVGDTRLSGGAGGLSVVGYERSEADLANHPIPNLAYTFYLRVERPEGNMQPVLFETMGNQLIGCVDDALGLSWLPTSRWLPGRTYQVRMNTLETSWQIPGTAKLFMELAPSAYVQRLAPASACRVLWARHTQRWQVGTLDVQF